VTAPNVENERSAETMLQREERLGAAWERRVWACDAGPFWVVAESAQRREHRVL